MSTDDRPSDGATAAAGIIRKRSVVIAGHATSVSLEEAFWDALKDIARARATSVRRLIAEIDSIRAGNLSSALRVFILEETKRRAGW